MSNYIIHNGELYHYGVKGMKWGHRKKQIAAFANNTGKFVGNTAKRIGNTGLGNMVKTDYEATKMRARLKKSSHDARTQSKATLIEAKYNHKNRKDLGMNKRETKATVKEARKNIKTTNKAIKAETKMTNKEIKKMRKIAYTGMTAGEKAMYNIGGHAISAISAKTGGVGYRAADTVMRNFGDQPLTAIENRLKNA